MACFFPGVTVGVMTFVNIFLWATKSSGAIPLGFFFSIIFLWWVGCACRRAGVWVSGWVEGTSRRHGVVLPCVWWLWMALGGGCCLARRLRRCLLPPSSTHPHLRARPHLTPPARRLLISIPLSYAGGIVAAKQEIRQYPTRTNQVGGGLLPVERGRGGAPHGLLRLLCPAMLLL